MITVFASICELEDASESAWPLLTFRGWIPTDNDKGLDSHGQRQGWHVDGHVDEYAKLLATIFFYKDEAAFGTAHLTPAQLIESIDGDVEGYVNVIRYSILQLPKKKTTATCPSFFSLRKQRERGNAIFRYWKNGLRETMPATEFAGKGWSVDSRGKGSDGDELTKENCVLDLSEYAFIAPDRKTATLACGCNPDTALCNSVANAMALFAASMRQQESHGADDVKAGTPESPASKDVSAGEAAESKSAELKDPESDENGDGSVGALDDLIKLDSSESSSSDGEPDGVSEKSVDSNWSDGDTDDGVADLVTDAWN
ncbi:unnamed protein product [Ectocarpus sp. CCAP 1310/34]|nr:unnamed protein product [Ectocarpus sp. CCAP 1310/34]